ncbi:MAG: protein-disulfide reductase DsbD [Gammaproteobacteria bacterium]|nr:protein-disulfide reductase DsbD [Gammaproteobacteria bacterium]
MTTRYLAALLLLLLTPAHAEQANEELLEADQAFSLSTRTVNGATLEARWKIAPDYYLYRDKFKFEALDGVTLKNPSFPRGKKKQDPLFGTVETYTRSVKVRLPFERREGAASARLRITAQGCNEPVGVCYPPIVKEVEFKLPPVKTTRAPATTVAAPVAEAPSLKDLTRSVNTAGGAAEPVDPEKAFMMDVTARGNDALLARIDIADCCYLYRDKMKFELTAADGAVPADLKLGTFALPPGKVKTDEFIGRTEIYEKGFEVTLPITGNVAPDRDLQLQITYQGCSEKGVVICYPPATKKFAVQFRGGKLSVAGAAEIPPASPPVTPTPVNGKLLLTLLTAFGAGLLLTFTPCVLPMVPILSSMLVGQGDAHIGKLRGGLISYSYVLGTAVTYTVAGVLAGLSGEQLQAYFQNPWAIGTFSTVLVLLALSLFGFYELQMPGFIQSHLHHRTHHLKGGSYVGAFFLGLVSALIVGACVSPVLITALGAAITSQNPVLGGAIMFTLAHGQGAILIALGVGAGFLLPKVGKWMDRVKHLFGALLIAVAIYLLGFIPEVPVLLLWATLLIVSAVYLGATQSLPGGASGWQYLWKGVGTVLLIWGVLALIGGFAGRRDILHPLPLSSMVSGTVPAGASPPAAEEPLFVRVSSLSDLENRLAAAKAAGKPAILDYYADWCTDCLRMEKATFTDPRVRQEMRGRFVLLQADVTDPNSPETKAIKGRFGVYGPPAMLFFAANGDEHRELRTYGFRNTDDFLVLLRKI